VKNRIINSILFSLILSDFGTNNRKPIKSTDIICAGSNPLPSFILNGSKGMNGFHVPNARDMEKM
jgi:hypothetical protein